jgi:hypothetical protein
MAKCAMVRAPVLAEDSDEATANRRFLGHAQDRPSTFVVGKGRERLRSG